MNEPGDEADDCTKALHRMHSFLDHELDEVSCDEIREHLNACEQCLGDFDVEQAMKQLVHRCCQGTNAPATLRATIMTTLISYRGGGK